MAQLSISDAARVTGVPVVYLIAEHWDAPLCKIGVTTNLRRRLATLRRNSPFHLHVLATWPMLTPEATYRFEQYVLRRYRQYRQRGEWFKLTPAQLFPVVQMEQEIARLQTELAAAHRMNAQLMQRIDVALQQYADDMRRFDQAMEQ